VLYSMLNGHFRKCRNGTISLDDVDRMTFVKLLNLWSGMENDKEMELRNVLQIGRLPTIYRCR
jgi:hypothetical protein